MGQQRTIGDWSARQVGQDVTLAAVADEEPLRPPTRRPDPPEDDDQPKPRRSERRLAFGLGLMVGLVPLIAAAGVVVGYQLAGGDDEGGAGERTVTQPAASVDPAAQTGSARIGPATSAAPAPATSAGPESEPVTSGVISSSVAPVVAVPVAAEVRDGSLFVGGTLPAEAETVALREFSLLAEALGLELMAETTVDAGAPVTTEIPLRFADAVFFDAGQDELTPAFRNVLHQLSDYLNQSESSLTIIAHTDASGSEAGNLHLAQHRAGAVFESLIAHGVDGGRLRVDARGEAEASGARGREASAERRVEFVLGLGL